MAAKPTDAAGSASAAFTVPARMGIFDVDELVARREHRWCRALQRGDRSAERDLVASFEPVARSAAAGFFAPA